MYQQTVHDSPTQKKKIMRVLIVDCFASTQRGRISLADLKYTVEKALEGPYYTYLTEVAVAVRPFRKLDDFIFDSEGVCKGRYADPASLKAFQNLDLVFIAGDEPSFMPWSESSRPLRMLLHQCLEFSLPTFISGSPAVLLVYTVHLKGDNIYVFNGRGQGSGGTAELRNMSSQVKRNIVVTHTFLDSETGNIYRKPSPFVDFSLHGNVGVFNSLKKQGVSVYKTVGGGSMDSALLRRGSSECELGLDFSVEVCFAVWSRIQFSFRAIEVQEGIHDEDVHQEGRRQWMFLSLFLLPATAHCSERGPLHSSARRTGI